MKETSDSCITFKTALIYDVHDMILGTCEMKNFSHRVTETSKDKCAEKYCVMIKNIFQENLSSFVVLKDDDISSEI